MLLTGGQIIAEYLVREKVPYLIGIPGHGIVGMVDAFIGKEEHIKVLQVRAEMSAVYMAYGYYQVAHKPLAVFTSIGPGALNTAIGLGTAYVDSVPVLLLTGDTHTYMFGKGVLQEIERRQDANNLKVLEPLVKRCWQVTAVRQLPTVLQRAFNLMLSGRRGPVLLALPMDVQADAADVRLPEPAHHEPAGRTRGDQGAVERAVKLLAQAKRPVILAGGGVHASGAWQELRQLAERLDAVVLTTLQAKSSFPEDHPLSGWLAGSVGTAFGNHFARTADVLLAIGCRFADLTASSYRKGATFSIPPTRLIHIDVDPHEIGKNYPVEVGIVGDARAVLGQLVEAMAGSSDLSKPAYRAELAQLRERWWASLANFRDPARVPVTMSCALQETRKFLDRSAIVTYSAGNPLSRILQEFPFYEPGTSITTGGFSTMGFTLPAAIGAKLAAPGRQVLGVAGDGDFLMTIGELATAVQYEVPVVMLVLNNGSFQSINDLQVGVFGPDRRIACEFTKQDGTAVTCDFQKIAEGFGCHAVRVSRVEEVQPALRSAFAAGRPAVVEVLINKEYPFSGGPGTGWWDVPVPAYLKDKREPYEKARAEEQV